MQLISRPDNEETLAMIAATNEDATEVVLMVQQARLDLYNAWALLNQGEGDLATLSEALHRVDMQVEAMQKHISCDVIAKTVMGETLNKLSDDYNAVVRKAVALEEHFEQRLTDAINSHVDDAVSEKFNELFRRDAFLEEQRTEWLADRMVEEGYDTIRDEEWEATEARLREARAAAEWELGYGDRPDAGDEED